MTRVTKLIWNDICSKAIVKKCDIKHNINSNLSVSFVQNFVFLQNQL
jgi:hypothetical protein